jgi:hypothetical protein
MMAIRIVFTMAHAYSEYSCEHYDTHDPTSAIVRSNICNYNRNDTNNMGIARAQGGKMVDRKTNPILT